MIHGTPGAAGMETCARAMAHAPTCPLTDAKA
jgi:hypothetical protein